MLGRETHAREDNEQPHGHDEETGERSKSTTADGLEERRDTIPCLHVDWFFGTLLIERALELSRVMRWLHEDLGLRDGVELLNYLLAEDLCSYDAAYRRLSITLALLLELALEIAFVYCELR